MRNQFDEDQNLPELSDEWLSDEELSLKQREKEREHAPSQPSPLDGTSNHGLGEPPDELAGLDNDKTSSDLRETNEETPRRESPTSEGETHGATSQQNSPGPEDTVSPTTIDPSHTQTSGTGSPGPRRSNRTRKAPTRFAFNKQHGHTAVVTYLDKLHHKVTRNSSTESCDMQHIIALCADPQFGLFENLPPHCFMLVSTDPQSRKNERSRHSHIQRSHDRGTPRKPHNGHGR